MDKQANDILELWFSEAVQPLWFNSTPEFDQQLKEDYEALWEKAANGELNHWLEEAESCLASIILLDQFPLNMFRGETKSFLTEQQAVDACLSALDKRFDEKLAKEKLSFLIMPLMHCENLEMQALSVEMFAKHKLQANLDFAKHHQAIIKKFGRFPHRNAILARESTPEEIAYLNSDNAFKG